MEIVVSSVRPFELIMGKVLGIGAMGLTQFIVWGVLVLGGSSVLGSVAAFPVSLFVLFGLPFSSWAATCCAPACLPR